VLIFGLDLPRRLAGEQIGALASGRAGIRFSQITADAEPPTVFVITAFESPYNELYAEAIAPVCKTLGLRPVRPTSSRTQELSTRTSYEPYEKQRLLLPRSRPSTRMCSTKSATRMRSLNRLSS
jgi:hypothetical protein